MGETRYRLSTLASGIRGDHPFERLAHWKSPYHAHLLYFLCGRVLEAVIVDSDFPLVPEKVTKPAPIYFQLEIWVVTQNRPGKVADAPTRCWNRSYCQCHVEEFEFSHWVSKHLKFEVGDGKMVERALNGLRWGREDSAQEGGASDDKKAHGDWWSILKDELVELY